MAPSNRFQSSFNGCKSRGRGVCFETSNVTALVIIFHAYAPRKAAYAASCALLLHLDHLAHARSTSGPPLIEDAAHIGSKQAETAYE